MAPRDDGLMRVRLRRELVELRLNFGKGAEARKVTGVHEDVAFGEARSGVVAVGDVDEEERVIRGWLALEGVVL